MWRWGQRAHESTGELKWTKPPFQPNGTSTESDSSNTWISLEEVKAAHERRGFDGVGYVVTVDVKETNDHLALLRFAPDTQRLMDRWRDGLEARLRSHELEATPAFEAHLSTDRSLIPSLALLFHRLALADGGASGGVTFEAARLTAVWCDYLERHTKKVYAAELYPGTEAAQLLAAKIQGGAMPDRSPVRDIYRHHWAGLSM